MQKCQTWENGSRLKKRIDTLDRCCQHRYITNIKENILELQLTPVLQLLPVSPTVVAHRVRGCTKSLHTTVA